MSKLKIIPYCITNLVADLFREYKKQDANFVQSSVKLPVLYVLTINTLIVSFIFTLLQNTHT